MNWLKEVKFKNIELHRVFSVFIENNSNTKLRHHV